MSFTLIFLNAILAAVSFSGVLWTISPLLFGVAVGYAALGTPDDDTAGPPARWAELRAIGREADFRAALIHVRENAESVALSRREGRLRAAAAEADRRAGAELPADHVGESQSGLFHDGLQLPDPDHSHLVVVAPQFIREEVEFGVITQSAVAFTQLLGAFSLIVNQFGSISSFAAVIARLSGFAEALEAMRLDQPNIETVEDRDRVAYERLTLRSLRDDGALVTTYRCRFLAECECWSRDQTKLRAWRCSARRPESGPAAKAESCVRRWTRFSFCPSSRT